MNARTSEEIGTVVRAAVKAAVWAPSVHNTQPWSFAIDGQEISVRADTERLLHVSDAAGRELLISCGAAIFNVQLALRQMGYQPDLRMLPDPDRPLLLATIRMGAATEADERTKLLYAEIERRRTHRGDFSDRPIPRNFIDALSREAEKEGVRLTPVRAEPAVRVLASVTRAAQDVQSQDRAFSLEVLRWSRTPESKRGDGVSPEAYPRHAERADPAFAQRDYTQGRPWGYERPLSQVAAASPGTVAVLTTARDSREEWLAAGSGLQRALLFASAYGVRAAFHTQALEFFHLREFVRQELCSGRYPQMIMRLGITFDQSRSMRRPLSEVFEEPE